MGSRTLQTAFVLVLFSTITAAQPSTRRLTTIGALRQFPGYFHLQNVTLRGEFKEDGQKLLLHSDDGDMRVVLDDGVRTTSGPVEVRGQLLDVGRLEATDPRAAPFAEGRDPERWPKPGEELFVRVTSVTAASPVTTLSIRALALDPTRYDGQKVTIVGNFRGRNLFGDVPGAPGKSRYDFVIRGAEGAVWVTGLRPRGKGFDLDIDRRFDSDQWLEVTGTVAYERGLVRIDATQLAAAKAPQAPSDVAEDTEIAPVPIQPLDVVFSSPVDGDMDVSASAPIRIQFSRAIDPKSVAGAIRIGYVGAGAMPPMFRTTYDAATRSLTIRFTEPLARFRTVRVEVVNTLKAFDGGVAKPWTITFTVAE